MAILHHITRASGFPFWRCTGGLLLFLLSCHDAPRDNPFDPALTPAVELQVALDDTAGTATLTWSQYEGQQAFSAYRVLRNEVERTRVDTLAAISQVAQTSFVDTALAPDTVYEYRVEVINAAGYAAESEKKEVRGYGVGAMALLPVESDPQAGTLILRWNRYVGPDFGAYQVRRRVGKSIEEEVLGQQEEAQDTSFVDRTAQAGVRYVYTVGVQAAGRELSSNSLEAQLDLPPVQILGADFNSATVTATLRWTRYAGPRFEAYQVLRRTAELAAQVVVERADLADTSFVDPGLLGNTEYFYQVKVLTERDEEVSSVEVSGSLHSFVSAWPLEVEEGEYVRLYREQEDRLTALVAGPGRVRLLFYSREGLLLGEQVLLENPFAGDPLFGSWGPPQAVATVRLADGSRLLSFADRSGELLGVLEFDAGGELLWHEEKIFEGALGGPAEEKEVYRGNWGISVFNSSSTNVGGPSISPKAAAFTAVEVMVDGVSRLQGDEFARRENWQPLFGPLGAVFDAGLLKFSALQGTGNVFSLIAATFTSSPWKRFSMHARVVLMEGSAGIVVGASDGGDYRIGWSLWYRSQQLELRYLLTQETQNSPFAILAGVPYGLRIEAEEGAFTTSVEHALRWSSPVGRSVLAGLVEFDGFVGVVAGDQPFILDAEAKADQRRPLGGAISEARSWTQVQRQRTDTYVGLCLPALNHLRYARAGLNRTTGEVNWPFDSPNLVSYLGNGVGHAAGELVLPLSFDVGPDGRFLVLDAGNARIQVFDAEGNYLTQWGRKGSNEGEFDFGTGFSVEALSGSVVVDQEGYIYVADVFNRRIQKFAP